VRPSHALTDSPLLYHTPDEWADSALEDVRALLSDHAYLERKAASNALELLNRWPEPNRPKHWERVLSSIARDEATHLNSVLGLLERRGGKLERLHKSTYASDLRHLVRKGQGPHEILDRLLISALIEARSCERFEILARRCKDKELARFYKNLWSAEAGHFQVFLQLGKETVSAVDFEKRWQELLEAEAEIIQHQPTGSSLHSQFTRRKTLDLTSRCS